jgi:protein phosphatase
MSLLCAYKTDTGRLRKHNEDYVWTDETTGVFIVADGLGGQEAGEVASQITATTVARLITDGLNAGSAPPTPTELERLMLKALEDSNRAVLAAAHEDGQIRKMGATIVALVVRLPHVYICHAGDARAYLARGTALIQLTQDDSYVAELVAAGVISKEDAKHHPFMSIVTKAVGQEPPLEPTFTQLTVAANDWLLLCSDGLSNMVSDEGMLSHLQKANGSPQHLVEALTQAANEAGGKDNISVIAVRVLPD